MKRILHRAFRHLAIKRNRLVSLYRKFFGSNNFEHAEYLKRFGGLHSLGERCSIGWNTEFMDPHLISIGNNCGISEVKFVTHNAASRIIENRTGKRFDLTGRIVIKDDVFIGNEAKINAGVTIGPWAMVGMGSVVTKDVPPNSVVAGNPARFICTMDEWVAKQERLGRRIDVPELEDETQSITLVTAEV